jgi:hypothetical protein
VNESEFRELLVNLGACREARDWARGKSLAEVWRSCDRADWLLWLCGRMAGQEGWPTRPQIILVACLCAERALPLFERKYPNDDRARKAIEAARAWANSPTEDRRSAAGGAAYAAAAAYADAAAYAAAAAAYAAAAADAADAADAAADAAAYAAYAADAAAYAAYAADVAAYAADARSAFGLARAAELKALADIVRENLTILASHPTAAA